MRWRCRLVVAVGMSVLGMLAAAAPAALGAPLQPGRGSLRIPARTHQLIVVSSPTLHPRDHIATLRAYVRSASGSPWRLEFGPWRAEIGYAGLRRHRHEGDGSTPIGVFGIQTTLYGNRPDPGGLHLRYHHLVCGDWWDEDPNSSQYNRFVHVPCGTQPAFAAGAEALWTETLAYPYFAVLRFNTDPVIGGSAAPGSGIFLHAWVNGPTAGCVALPRVRLLRLLRWLRSPRHATVAIGTSAQVF